MRSIFLEKPDPLVLRLKTAGWGQVMVWLPVVVMAIIIRIESTDTFSAAHTSSWIRPIVERIVGGMSDARWEAVHHYMRKTGHFCGYGTLCLTFLRAWLLVLGGITDLGRAAWRWRACFTAILCTAVVASLDEIHQSFIPSRTGTVQDVVLDSTGAAVSCALVWLFFWQKRTGLRRPQGSHFPG
jgi:VanZ family protein